MTHEPRSTKLLGKLAAFLKGIAVTIVGTAATALSAAIIISVSGHNYEDVFKYYLEIPAKVWLQESFFAPDISEEEAFIAARVNVGSRALYAIPFHNIDDPNQFVAVWADKRDDECATQQSCPFGLGTLELVLLTGKGRYEKVHTNNRAVDLTIGGSIRDRASAGTFTPSYFAVTDWNGDGSKEVLSIADQNFMTAGYTETFISLFDTATRQTVQLKAMETVTDRSTQAVGTSDPLLIGWLHDRLAEYRDLSFDSECARTLQGRLTCSNAPSPTVPADEEDYGDFQYLFQQWIIENGSDFVFGKLKLSFKKSLLGKATFSAVCKVNDGPRRLDLEFKGELYLTETTSDETALLYLQDGLHHREMPGLVVGKKYYWLPLFSNDGEMVAIDKTTLESVPASTKEWPKLRESVLDDGRKTKEYQASTLELSGRRLIVNGVPLTLSISGEPVPQSEFASAAFCDPNSQSK
ncbi:hypothetical protein [Rhizobium leguminosarum]|uniref:hypothetical protein n=1 Tax=Rhizobium leguminosarum TaxID=384 RepID=UPI001C91EB59|nr:hypothetical protein [Rhizobium leguminosarum]MBY2989002.1 hypothetical protein [Rhizobium leguminosarum]